MSHNFWVSDSAQYRHGQYVLWGVNYGYLKPEPRECQTLSKKTPDNCTLGWEAETGLNLWPLYSHLFLTHELFTFHSWPKRKPLREVLGWLVENCPSFSIILFATPLGNYGRLLEMTKRWQKILLFIGLRRRPDSSFLKSIPNTHYFQETNILRDRAFKDFLEGHRGALLVNKNIKWIKMNLPYRLNGWPPVPARA
mgnify:CR=1 FL=1